MAVFLRILSLKVVPNQLAAIGVKAQLKCTSPRDMNNSLLLMNTPVMQAFSSSHGKIEEAQKLRVGDMQAGSYLGSLCITITH